MSRLGTKRVVPTVLVGLLIAVGLPACGGDDTTPPQAEPATTATAAEPAEPAPEADVIPGGAECASDRAATAPFGLNFTSLLRTPKGLLVTWETNRPMPSSGTVLYAIDASDEGDASLQLGVKYLDGAQVAFFVFDFSGAQTNIDGGAVRNGNRLEALFPQDAIEDLVGRFRWRSALNVRGADVGFCPPSRGASPLGPTLPFPKPLR